MLKRFTLFLVLLIVSCSPGHLRVRPASCTQGNLIPDIGAPNSVQNDFGSPIFWDQDVFPIRVVVDMTMREKRKEVIREAILVWNEVTNLQVFSYEEGPLTSENGIITILEEPLPRNECGNQTYGLARRFFRTDFLGIRTVISRGMIRLHTNVPDDRILHTAIHELGHALGLHHDREIESVMYPYNNGQDGSISDEDKDYVIRMISEPRQESFINFNIGII